MSSSNCFSTIWMTPIYHMLVRILFYGMNIILFCIGTHILRQQKQGPKTVLLSTTIALSVLSTVNAVLSTMLDLQTFALLTLAELGVGKCDMLIPEISVVKVIGVTNVAMSAIADGLLIYRCYIVWTSRKLVIAVPTVLLLGSTGYGLAAAFITGFMEVVSGSGPKKYYNLEGVLTSFDPRISFILSATTNVVVTGLTAGRIWWISRQARFILGRDFTRRYSTTIAIIVESGLIYTLSITLYLVIAYVYAESTDYPGMLYSALTQIVSLAPMLMIVRVGLGVSTDSVEHPVAAARTDTKPRLTPLNMEAEVLRSPAEISIIDIRRQERNLISPIEGIGRVSVREA